MKFSIQPYSIYELGKRERQEDSIYPSHGAATPQDRLFILCDGMGGHSAGDVASATVCEALSSAVMAQQSSMGDVFAEEDFRLALAQAYDVLDTKDNGAAKKMGTTLTFLKFHSKGAMIAHIGDSRVYHIRPGKTPETTQILFQTLDHSLVNDLVKVGELTPEEAKTSSQRNIITRAMQPLMSRRSKADLYHAADIQAGDYFMLCSDGILEQMDDFDVQEIFSDRIATPQEKIETIIRATQDNADNHSAYVIQVLDVVYEQGEQAAQSQTDCFKPAEKSRKSTAPRPATFNKRHLFLSLLMALVVLLILLFMAYKFILS